MCRLPAQRLMPSWDTVCDHTGELSYMEIGGTAALAWDPPTAALLMFLGMAGYVQDHMAEASVPASSAAPSERDYPEARTDSGTEA